jgi:hypothetical protein
MSSEELVKQYKQAGIEIQRIRDDEGSKKEALKTEKDQAWELINEKREQLRKYERDMNNALELKEKAIEKDAERQVEPLELLRERVKRIVQFLEVQERFEPVVLEAGMWIPAGEWQDWVHQDDFLKIRMLVYENSKRPVNRFTAAVCISTAISRPLWDMSTNCMDLGHFKTLDEAKGCTVRRKDKVLKTEMRTAEALRTEYLDVVSKYKLSDFDELFEYYCSDCRAVFKNIPESHNRAYMKSVGKGYVEVVEKCDGRLYRRIIGGM